MGYSGWEDFEYQHIKKDPLKQYQGLKNKEIGAAFEEIILISCENSARRGIAFVDKTPEPFKVLGNKKRNSAGKWVFEGVFTKAAQPDFQGTFKDGKSIVFEAKTSQSDRILQSVITEEQSRSLDGHCLMEAYTYVFVSLGLKTFYRVPWPVWRNMKVTYGHKYMTKDDLAQYQLTEKNGLILLFDGIITNTNVNQ